MLNGLVKPATGVAGFAERTSWRFGVRRRPYFAIQVTMRAVCVSRLSAQNC